MRSIIYLLLLVCWVGCNAPAKTTSNLALQDYPARVAILPCQVILTHKPLIAQWYDDRQMGELTRSMSIAVQGILYNKMKEYSGQKGIVTEFQSDELTNDKLASQKISFATLFASSRKELCQLLGVDAVIAPQLVLSQAPPESMREASNPFWSVRFNVNLFNNALDNPVWAFKGTQRSSKVDQRLKAGLGGPSDYAAVLRSFEVPIERLMKNCIKEYPFRKN